jgi:hypothetical protein
VSIGRHHSARAISNTWLTPPSILSKLGPFDLDPCAAPLPRPWPTAARHIALPEDGLAATWEGRVWMNPPYSGEVDRWMRKLAGHGHGTALTFARTETSWFWESVWQKADAVLFIAGRLHFCRPSGHVARANAGAPSVLAAYGTEDADTLAASGIPGAFMRGWRLTVDLPPAQPVLDIFSEAS